MVLLGEMFLFMPPFVIFQQKLDFSKRKKKEKRKKKLTFEVFKVSSFVFPPSKVFIGPVNQVMPFLEMSRGFKLVKSLGYGFLIFCA